MNASKIIGGAIAALAVAGSLTVAYAQSEGAKAPGVNPVNPAGTPAGPGMQQAPATAAGMNGTAPNTMNSASTNSTMDNSATSGQTTERAAQTDRN